MKNRTFSSLIIDWYEKNRRDLPWRQTRDAFKVWLSEIILQQTRVSQGLPYYIKFTDRFSSVQELAEAREEEILRLWQGLGYYSRARNLHKCAQTVVQKHNGIFPGNYAELLTLPGIGPYTAAAISSIVTEEKVPVVDGNVLRLASRYFGLDSDIANTKTQKRIRELLEEHIKSTTPSLFNQAMMEMGALQCTPQSPDCSGCPLKDSCYAYAHNLQESLPVKLKKVKRRKRFFNYLIMEHENKVAMQIRSAKDIWQNMYEFVLVEDEGRIDLQNSDNRLLQLILSEGAMVKEIVEGKKHVLSHQDIVPTFVHFQLSDHAKIALEAAGHRFYAFEDVESLPKSVLIDKFWQKNFIDYI